MDEFVVDEDQEDKAWFDVAQIRTNFPAMVLVADQRIAEEELNYRNGSNLNVILGDAYIDLCSPKH